MKIKSLITLATACLISIAMTSCFKDEPANAEADIVHVSLNLSNPLDLFYDISDTAKNVPYTGDSIIFYVKPNADLTQVAPQFSITPGAKISPASGSSHDFSHGDVAYTVTSEDGEWSRTYYVGFRMYSTNSYFSFDEAHIAQEYLTSSSPSFYVWDGLTSANLGYYVAKSSTAQPEDYPTYFSADGYKDGCAVLQTCDTGFWGRVTNKRIAAGNIFLGDFDITQALTNTLRATKFGIPCDKKPLRYCGYYKYKAGEQMQNAAGEYIEGTDSCSIYAVIYRNKDGAGVPVTLTGEDVITNLNIIAIARLHNPQQTDEWTYFDVPFVYTREPDPDILAAHGYNFTFVASSSHNGDLFEGAVGSKLWIDEVRIIFEGE